MAANCSPPFPAGLVYEKVRSALTYVETHELQRRTDDGNALLFVELHGQDVRYATDAKQWYAWDGQRWHASGDTLVLNRARSTARTLMDLAMDIEDDQQKLAAVRYAASSLSKNRIKAIPELALADSRIGVQTRSFDANPYVLNTPTGILDLRTGVETPHVRDAYLSKMTNVGYSDSVDAPEWRGFVSWAMGGDPAMVEFLQRSVGYALFGETQENVLFLLHGGGANGKTTFLNVWERILGDYALHAEADLLTPKDGGSTTGQADLFGKRFVVASETKAGKTLDERTVKQLTGGDTITARKLYKDNFSFVPSHTIFFAMNDRPTISDSSYGMWRRVLLVPWEQRVEPGRQDKDKAQRIVEKEGPGVLAWAVEGFQKWHRDSDLVVPSAVRAATDSYRTEEDSLGLFIEENLEIGGADDYVNVASISSRYSLWCSEQSIGEKNRISPRKVLHAVAERQGLEESSRMINGDRSKKIVGYQLTGRGTQWG
ncbi:phage/plasmid primase, P4 family [Rhodococcus sp. G-MC3]|uniref:DNA primase family protein n=1 Tax=Rhodococcus sp. G-MC3 TaxID=3046209 RepID=UPI0024B92078|nr:phage/plasmid primase, P4 family [Rhodococcus sp. G-MC3]MDJ0395457.1 phage/plasmid primase, P4 family [Rhodococcus sp. G-MC3]